MHCDCTCEHCAGRETYTADYMRRMELRMVWRMSQERRQGYYALVAKHRGQESADRIRRAIEDEEGKRR